MDECNVDIVHVQTVPRTITSGHKEDDDDVAVNDNDEIIDQSEDELDRLIHESIQPNENQLEYDSMIV